MWEQKIDRERKDSLEIQKSFSAKLVGYVACSGCDSV